MAITAVDIVQDNITGGCDLLNIASPLVFLVDATYNTAPPDNLYARLYDSSDVLLGTYRCMPYKDMSGTVRRFAFAADEILRQYLPPIDDFTQSGNTLEFISAMTKHFKLKFQDTKTDTAGYHIKTGSLAGLTVSQFPYPVTAYIHGDNAGLSATWFITGDTPQPITDAYAVAQFRAAINVIDPTFLGVKGDVYAVTGGYSIRNNFTYDCAYTGLPSLTDVACESFPQTPISDTVEFEAINAASQFGQAPANTGVFTNAAQKMIGTAGQWAYAYFYDSDGTKVITAQSGQCQ